MAYKYANRVRVTVSGTPGTNSVITLGSPVAGFQSFAAGGIAASDTFSYVIEDGSAWEIGTGLFGGTSMMRDNPTSSDGAGVRLNLSSAAQVYVAPTAASLSNPQIDTLACAGGAAVSGTLGVQGNSTFLSTTSINAVAGNAFPASGSAFTANDAGRGLTPNLVWSSATEKAVTYASTITLD